LNKPPHLALTISGHDGRKVRVAARRYATGTRFEIVEMSLQANGGLVPSDNCATLDIAEALRAAEFLIRACRDLEQQNH
jgi:hypothetical protein